MRRAALAVVVLVVVQAVAMCRPSTAVQLVEATELVSIDTSGAILPEAGGATVSASGRFVFFHVGGPSATAGLYERDLDARTTRRVLPAAPGAVFSPDGRFVAYWGQVTAFSPRQVYLHDLVSGTSKVVSRTATGQDGSSDSVPTAFSSDGRYLAFQSWAHDLVADPSRSGQMFIYDVVNDEISAVTLPVVPNGNTIGSLMAGGGQFMLFASEASNLVAGDNNGLIDVFVHDRASGATERVFTMPVTSPDPPAEGGYMGISGDGRYVTYVTSARLVAADTDDGFDLYLRDRQLGTIERVSAPNQLTRSSRTSISDDGRLVTYGTDNVFTSPDAIQVWLRDRSAGSTSVVSVDEFGEPRDAWSSGPHMTADGRYVAYRSGAKRSSTGTTAVYLRDLQWTPPPVPDAQTRGSAVDGAAVTVRRADPVDTATGAFVIDPVVDLEASERAALRFERSYNSNGPTVGAIGRGWATLLDSRVVATAEGAVVRTDSGGELLFRGDGSGGYRAPVGTTSELLPTSGGGFELRRAAGSKALFDGQGRIIASLDRAGLGVQVTYNPSGEPAALTDHLGRSFTLQYDNDLLQSVTSTADSRQVAFEYSGNLLTAVTDVRGMVTEYSYDSAGRLSAVKDPADNWEVRNTYNADGRVVEQLDPLDNKTTFDWNPATQTSTMTDPEGNTWRDIYAGNVLQKSITPAGSKTFLWNSQLRLVAHTDERGHKWRYTYDARGNLLTRTAPAPLAYSEAWTYNSSNQIVTHRDRRGNTTTFDYDPIGRLTKTTFADGTSTKATYTATGQPATSTDGRGAVTSYTYDTHDNLASLTTPEGRITTWTYDQAGRPLTTTSPRGNAAGAQASAYTTTRTFDPAGNLLIESDALGHTTTRTYDETGRLTSVVDAEAGLTTYVYNPAGELTSVTRPGGRATAYDYDRRGLPIRETAASGAVTTFSYDAAGRLATRTTPRGNRESATADDHTWTYDYDATGNLTSVTDPLAHETTRTFDALNRLASERDAVGLVTTYGYDENDNLVAVTDALGKTATWTYDKLNRRTAATNAVGKTSTRTYDGNGNLTTEASPLGHATRHSYDDDNLLISTTNPRGTAAGAVIEDHTRTYVRDHDGNIVAEADALATTTWTVDAEGRRVAQDDALGRTTLWTFDGLDRITAVTAPGSGTTSYSYDTAGDLVAVTDANSHTTTYAYNADGRMTSRTSPTGQRWTYGYDADSNLTTSTDAKANAVGDASGGTVTRTWDAAGRLTRIDYSDATPDVSFTLDATGRRTSMVDGYGIENRTYDATGRLKTVTRGLDTFTYAYDDAGRLLSRKYPDNSVTTNTYTDDGRLAAVSSPAGTTTYEYDSSGALTTTSLPNGIIEARTYDRSQRLASIVATRGSTVLDSYQYARDALGNPTSVVSATANESYTYDAADRITSACYNAPCATASPNFATWTYDLVGNRTSESSGATTTTYTHNAADELTSSSGPSGTTLYVHDPNGNLIAAGLDTFTYDLERRMLTATTSGGAVESYAYDGDGKRVVATSSEPLALSSTTTITKWDEQLPVPEVANETIVVGSTGAGTVNRRYGYGNDRIAVTANNKTSYYLRDGIGSITKTTSTTGTPEWSYRYSPFGTGRSAVQHDATAANQPFRFADQQLARSGLYNLRARQYDPKLGRFTTTDPLTQDIGDPRLSAYIYADARPTVLDDPTGEKGRHIDVVDAPGPSWLYGGNYLDKFEDCFQNGTPSNFCDGYQTLPPSLQAVDRFLIRYGPILVASLVSARAPASRAAPQAIDDIGLSGRGLVPAAGTRVRPTGIPYEWRIVPTRSGGGARYYDPTNPGNSVRVMQGSPNSPFPNSQAPYVRWQRNGQPLDVNGNVLPTANSPDAHIPLGDFRFLPESFG